MWQADGKTDEQGYRPEDRQVGVVGYGRPRQDQSRQAASQAGRLWQQVENPPMQPGVDQVREWCTGPPSSISGGAQSLKRNTARYCNALE